MHKEQTDKHIFFFVYKILKTKCIFYFLLKIGKVSLNSFVALKYYKLNEGGRKRRKVGWMSNELKHRQSSKFSLLKKRIPYLKYYFTI